VRIGEILLEHGWVDWETFALAVGDQPRAGLRLCSLLVSRGVLTFDDAARALGEQHGVAAVTKRHLAHRDRDLPSILPGELARKAMALPIGRKGDGTLIVCVRDPSPRLHEALSRAAGEPIMVAIAPARFLERLVALAYPVEAIVELDVEPEADDDFDVDLELEAGDSGSLDVDFSDPDPPAPAPPVSRSKPLPVTIRPLAAAASTPRPAGTTLEGTIASLQDIDEIGWLFDAIMSGVATRWSAAVLLAVKEEVAVGMRGHGPKLPKVARLFEIALGEPSIVRETYRSRRLCDDVPADAGDAQASLSAALGDPRHPMAAPLVVGDRVTHVLVVGDPRSEDPEDAIVDLARLVEAIDEARARIEQAPSPEARGSE
jgi:hypothetical protein